MEVWRLGWRVEGGNGGGVVVFLLAMTGTASWSGIGIGSGILDQSLLVS